MVVLTSYRPAFVSHEMPFPIILADSWSAAPGVAGDQIPQTNALYEFNACEDMFSCRSGGA